MKDSKLYNQCVEIFEHYFGIGATLSMSFITPQNDAEMPHVSLNYFWITLDDTSTKSLRMAILEVNVATGKIRHINYAGKYDELLEIVEDIKTLTLMPDNNVMLRQLIRENKEEWDKKK